MDAWAVVTFLDLIVDGVDLHAESHATLIPLADSARAPGVEALSKNPKGVTHHGDGLSVLVLFDEGEDQRPSLAKQANLFRMSRSMRSGLLSARSRRSSSSIAGRWLLQGRPFHLPC